MHQNINALMQATSSMPRLYRPTHYTYDFDIHIHESSSASLTGPNSPRPLKELSESGDSNYLNKGRILGLKMGAEWGRHAPSESIVRQTCANASEYTYKYISIYTELYISMLYLYSADIKSSRIQRSEIRYRLASTSIIIQHALKFRVISRTEWSAEARRATRRS